MRKFVALVVLIGSLLAMASVASAEHGSGIGGIGVSSISVGKLR